MSNGSLVAYERRDVKGLYPKARQGIVRQFTGIDDVYEVPEKPELVIDTEQYSLEECIEQLYKYVIANCRLAANRIIGSDNEERIE